MRRLFHTLARPFQAPQPLTVAREELVYAELELLKAQSQVEYSVAMLSYQQARVGRLRKLVAESTPEAPRSLRTVQ